VFFVNSLLAQEELGNGYLFPEFEKGTVVLKKGSRVPALLNYQMQVQEMLFIDNDNQILTLTNLPDILFITINERRFVPAPSGSIFYEEINTGNGSFFIQHKSNMLSQGKEAAYGGYSQTSATTSVGVYYRGDATGAVQLKTSEKFIQKREYYFYLKSGNSYKRFISVKTFGKLFPKAQAAKIDSFAREHAINFTKTDDVAKIVDFAFSLKDK